MLRQTTKLLLALALASGGPAFALPECSVRVQPAATLLVPYFEVDLDDPNSKSTLLAVGNASGDPAVARVTLWTDWGLPTLAFDVYLAADGLQTLNLRQMFQGVLPTTGAPGFADCANPVATPVLGASERAVLRARHTGQPDPNDGECYGSTRGGAGVATGFVTVDAMNGCSPPTADPTDIEYFINGGSGHASNANLLYGDFFLVDPGNDFAQGNAAVHLVANPAKHTSQTFYSDLGFGADDARAPLGTINRTRFLVGGGFDGGTEMVLFAMPSVDPTINGGIPCGQRTSFIDTCQYLRFTMRPESGGAASTDLVQPVTEISGVYRLSSNPGADVQTPTAFGSVDVENRTLSGCQVLPTGEIAMSSWIMPLYSAEGRYSVGLDSIRIEPNCS